MQKGDSKLQLPLTANLKDDEEEEKENDFLDRQKTFRNN
jgi:hypothetical protein